MTNFTNEVDEHSIIRIGNKLYSVEMLESGNFKPKNRLILLEIKEFILKLF